jgi:hypothetical protein
MVDTTARPSSGVIVVFSCEGLCDASGCSSLRADGVVREKEGKGLTIDGSEG